MKCEWERIDLQRTVSRITNTKRLNIKIAIENKINGSFLVHLIIVDLIIIKVTKKGLINLITGMADKLTFSKDVRTVFLQEFHYWQRTINSPQWQPWIDDVPQEPVTAHQ